MPGQELLERARRVYRSYGYAPIDSAALEYTEILLGKGGEESDKLIYRFTDHGGRDVALRFDLTVPFARFAAQHIAQLGTPFRRYHMGPVWRGENTAHGRFREFWQCDFDTIGTTANAADIETALVIYDLMRALELERFHIQVNNRLVLSGLLEEFGLLARSCCRPSSKLAKIGRDGVAAEMVEKTGISTAAAVTLLDLAQAAGQQSRILDRLQRDFGSNTKAAEGIRRLRELLDVAALPVSVRSIFVSICRSPAGSIITPAPFMRRS